VSTPRTDDTGAAFVRFVVDERHGWALTDGKESWDAEVITGCVYPERGLVFVKRGVDTYPAEILLAQKVPLAPASTCRERAVEPAAHADATPVAASARTDLR
jgi:hypothetical protein